MRLLPGSRASRSAPKPVIGFSDITALHQLLQRQRLVSIHGPVVTQFRPRMGRARAPLRAFSSPRRRPQISQAWKRTSTVRPKARSSAATFGAHPASGYAVPCAARGRHPPPRGRWRASLPAGSHVDHLALAGVFRQVRGIVLGEFSGCEDKDADYSSAIAARAGQPRRAFPARRDSRSVTARRTNRCRSGCDVRLDAGSRRLTFLEGAAGWGAAGRGESATRLAGGVSRARRAASAARRLDSRRTSGAFGGCRARQRLRVLRTTAMQARQHDVEQRRPDDEIQPLSGRAAAGGTAPSERLEVMSRGDGDPPEIADAAPYECHRALYVRSRARRQCCPRPAA